MTTTEADRDRKFELVLSEALHEMLGTGECIGSQSLPEIRIVRRDAATQHICKQVKAIAALAYARRNGQENIGG